jgi:hypothetical protein
VFTQQDTINSRAHLSLTNLLITSLLVLCFSQWFLLFHPPNFFWFRVTRLLFWYLLFRYRWAHHLCFLSTNDLSRSSFFDLSIYIMVRKWQLLGSCMVRDHWSWPGASLYFTFTFENYGECGSADPLQLLLPYTDLEKICFSIFTAVLGWFLHLERPWFYFCVMSRNSSESSAISIAYNSLKLNKITSVVYECSNCFYSSCLFHSQICRARKLLRA